MSTVESIARPRRNGERRRAPTASISKESPAITGVDRKSGSAEMPRPISYAVFCLKKKKEARHSTTSVTKHESRNDTYINHPMLVMTLTITAHTAIFPINTPPTQIYTLSLHDALPI